MRRIVFLVALIIVVAVIGRHVYFAFADDSVPEYTASPSASTTGSQESNFQTGEVTPTPTITAPAKESTAVSDSNVCQELKVVSGQGDYAPTEVSFEVLVGDSSQVEIYRYHFGDGVVEDSGSATIAHRYSKANVYEVFVEVKGTDGVWYTSGGCRTKVTVNNEPIEVSTSGCTKVVKNGDTRPPVATVAFEVVGYDHSGPIQGYKMVYDDQTSQEQQTSVFTREYTKPGTFRAQGYIKDSKGNWVGGDMFCVQWVRISTGGVDSQPETGVATAVWVAIGSLMAGGLLARVVALKKLRE